MPGINAKVGEEVLEKGEAGIGLSAPALDFAFPSALELEDAVEGFHAVFRGLGDAIEEEVNPGVDLIFFPHAGESFVIPRGGVPENLK